MITVQDKVQVETIGLKKSKSFTIATNGESFSAIMDSLYPDKVTAALTELSVNAVDSHREAGVKRRFDLELPTAFAPVLRIRDYGTSMSHDFMMSEGKWEDDGYAVAFKSTKTKSNLCDGAKGIGRLTAFCLSDTYVAVCFKGGTKRTYSVYRNSERIPDISLISKEKTSEPDGFLLEIAVNPRLIDEFERKAAKVYRFFNDEEKPNIKSHDDFEIPENEYAIKDEDGDYGLLGSGKQPMAIMGCYAYPIESEFITGLTSQQKSILDSGLVAHFNIGDVGVQTNRRGLHYNEHTINSIKKKVDEVIAKITPQIINSFDGKNTYEKMALRADLLYSGGKFSNLSGFVKDVVSQIAVPPQLDLKSYGMKLETYTHSWRRRGYKINKSVTDHLTYHTNAVIYFARKQSQLRGKAKKFFSDYGNQDKRLIFIIVKKKSDTVAFANQFGFDVLEFPDAETLPGGTNNNNGGEHNKVKALRFVTGSGYRWTQKDSWTEEDFEEEDKIVYVYRKGYTLEDDEPINDLEVLNDRVENYKKMTGEDIAVYGLTKRQRKLKKDGWVSFDSLYKKTLKEYREKQRENAAVLLYWQKNYSDFNDVADSIKKLNLDDSHELMIILKEYEEVKSIKSKVVWKLVEGIKDVKPSDKYKYGLSDVRKKYPILFGISSLYDKRPAGFWTDMTEYVKSKN